MRRGSGPRSRRDVGLLDDAGHAADRRAEDDSDARRIEAVQRRVGHRLAAGGDTQQHVPLELPRLLRRDDLRRVEALHLAGDADRQPVGVEAS